VSAFLDASVRVRRPTHTVDVALSCEPGDVVAVIGPNGSGKTTLLQALAGLVPVDDGWVHVDGDPWTSRDGAAVPVQRRQLGMVFQDLMLFPHLTALDNVAFGLRSRGATRREAAATARGWLERLGVDELADRRPSTLSGGQAQRVALARALATEPRLLLLDEPMAALDVGVATTLRIELAAHLADFPGVSLLVTHDAIDALTVANRVLVLEDGRVAQAGTPAEVSQRPRSSHVARLVGLNVMRGRADDRLVRLDAGQVLEAATYATGPVFAAFPPSAVTLTLDEPHGSARNRWRGRVQAVAPHGGAVRVHLTVAGGPEVIADVTPASATGLRLGHGRSVWLSVKATEVSVYGVKPVSCPVKEPGGKP